MKFSISNHHLVIRLDNNLCTTAKDHTTRRRRLSKRVRLLLTAANQWLQIDVGPPTLITGVVTKGRGDGRRNQWVVRYRVSYSNDSHVWYFYKDSSHVEVKVRCKRKHLITTITILDSALRQGQHLNQMWSGIRIRIPDYSVSGCLPDRSRNVIDSSSCLRQPFRQDSYTSLPMTMRNANKSPKIPYSASVRKMEKWSGIHMRDQTITKT